MRGSSRSGSSASDIDMPEALQALAAERGITLDTLLSALADALESAYKRLPGAHEYAWVTIDPDSFEFRVFAMALDDDGDPIGDEMDVTPNDFGRIAAQTAKQVMSQRLREIDREQKYEEYAGREGDIVTGIIQQNDSRYTLLDLGRVEALLPQAEQVPYERPEPGARVKAYIVEVRKTSKGPQIVVSRTHPGLIRRLFELEVPEIADGVVELKACAREPGHRTKIAVWSNDNNVDPVGACVGARGARVRMVVNELRGEKIDIVPFSEDPPDFVAKALSPARVKEVRIDEETGTATVIVPDFQLSLAIGKEGQNARLAARLTGWRVDIKSETQIAEEEAGIGQYAEGAAAEEDYAEGEWKENADTGDLEWHPADGGPALTAEQWDAAADADAVPVDADPVDQVGDTAAVAPEEAAVHAEAAPGVALHGVLAAPPSEDTPLDEALAAAFEVEEVPVAEIPGPAAVTEVRDPDATHPDATGTAAPPTDTGGPDAPVPAGGPDDERPGPEPARPDEATP